MQEMSLQEAYKLLELEDGASVEDANKAFRKLSVKYHPDRNNGDDTMFKKINTAKQTIERPPQNNFSNSDFDFDIFSHIPFGFNQQRAKTYKPRKIIVNQTISFKESVLGTTIKISFNRTQACNTCNGQSEKTSANGCRSCDGFGRVVMQKGQFIQVVACSKCKGPKKEKCNTCGGKGIDDVNVSLDVKIPGGVRSGNILRLRGMGDFYTLQGNQLLYADAELAINVMLVQGLTLIDNDVHSSIDISLLDALRGLKINTETVLGTKLVDLPKLTKNNDKISIPAAGVSGKGKHILTVNVKYPDNTKELISMLEKKEKSKDNIKNFGPDYSEAYD